MYCAYRDCSNVALPFSKISFFSLPSDGRRKIWIENSGNEALRSISAKTKKVFCEAHFDAKDMRKQFMRTTLRKDAVPVKYVPSLHDTTTLTEIFDDEDADDVPKMNMSNGTESQSDTDAHHIEYVYMLDEEKSQTTEQDVPSDLFDTIEMTEEDVDEQKKIEKPTKPDWADVESGIEIKSPVKMSQPEIVVPNKRRRSGSLLESSEESSTPPVLPQNETKNVTNPAMSHQKEPVTNTLAPVETTEMIVSTRSNTNPMESHDEETLFALSLVGQLKRLPPQKLAAAKCHILTYLMQLEYGNGNTQFS